MTSNHISVILTLLAFALGAFYAWLQLMEPSDIPFWVDEGLLVFAGLLLLAAFAVFAHGHNWLRFSMLPLGQLGATQYDLMPLLELRALAERRGWNMGSLHVRDFMRALDHAGAGGLLKFHGKQSADTDLQDILRDKPPVEVPLHEWRNLRVSPNGLMDPDCQDNLATELHKENPWGERVYSDVHVERAKAPKWLRTNAARFRGQHEKEDRSGEGQ